MAFWPYCCLYTFTCFEVYILKFALEMPILSLQKNSSFVHLFTPQNNEIRKLTFHFIYHNNHKETD